MQLNKNLTPEQVLYLVKVLYPGQEWEIRFHFQPYVIHIEQKSPFTSGIHIIQFNKDTTHLRLFNPMHDEVEFDFDEKATIDKFLEII